MQVHFLNWYLFFRMLADGFEGKVKQLMEVETMPPKEWRVTLMFSATFPAYVQAIASGSYSYFYIDQCLVHIHLCSSSYLSQFVFSLFLSCSYYFAPLFNSTIRLLLISVLFLMIFFVLFWPLFIDKDFLFGRVHLCFCSWWFIPSNLAYFIW